MTQPHCVTICGCREHTKQKEKVASKEAEKFRGPNLIKISSSRVKFYQAFCVSLHSNPGPNPIKKFQHRIWLYTGIDQSQNLKFVTWLIWLVNVDCGFKNTGIFKSQIIKAAIWCWNFSSSKFNCKLLE